MRYIRLLVLSAVLLFAVITAISLFIPSRVRISRALTMQASTVAIEQELGDMRHWKNWNPFFANVADTAITAQDTSGGKLNAMTVRGTRVEWKKKIPGEYIAAMTRSARKPVLNGWTFIRDTPSDSSTVTVHWYMDFYLRWYPWEKFGSILMEKTYGPAMEKGLSQLKKQVELNLSSH